ncbi:MAG: tRNA (adenosine(37)-N6)-threonylcarbamoyltransferase complex transferase subunit TsaD [Planctomycetaceae bacterium]|jgi:N6-L-threonylcarbamoyladenine synthase|nr:tRNA (adenosine(37)-N6)-threonylcarbamoyltransferase complex transferase subunit TsaD [Planctomycetaceae bacterium]
MTRILTLETTCDETAAAVITDSLEVLGSVVASQDKLHQQFGGVVPEIASRAHLENIVPVIDETMRRAGILLSDLDAIAVANTPGLAGSLLVGLSAAKSLCVALQKPLLAVNHLQAHIYACKIAFQENPFPCLGLIVSGGHSSLYCCTTPIDFTPLGGTIDDAAGEAFDKVAAMLGLPYPGGPSLQKAAEKGNPNAYSFPRSLLEEPERLAFSFSGLKTAVRYRLVGPGKTTEPATAAAGLSEQEIADIAASFQEAAVDCLVGKSIQALRKTGMKTLCIGGGVAANLRFRQKMEHAVQKERVRLLIAPVALCTDNAVMGAIAIERFNAGLFEPLDLNIHPGLIR